MVGDAEAREPAVSRLSFGRSVAIGMVLGVALLFVIGATWFWWETEGAWRRYPVLGVEDRGDDLNYYVWMGCIEGEIRASVSENDDRAAVLVEVRGERSENDCMRGVGITLTKPLGVREFIDRSTGDSVPMDCLAQAPTDSGSSC